MDSKERKVSFLINAAYYAVIGVVVILFFRYAFKYVSPFVVGFLIAYCFHKPIDRLSSKTNWSKKLCSAVLITSFLVVLILLLVVIGSRLGAGMRSLFLALPTLYAKNVEPIISDILQWYEHFDFMDELGPTIGSILESTASSILSSLGNLVTNISVRIVSFTTNFVTNIPSYLMLLLVTIISTYFISFDYDNIVAFIKLQLSDKVFNYIIHIKNHLVNTIGRYIGSYSIILCISFIELSILMSIKGVASPVLVGLLIALLDILPLIGTSMMILPWAAIELIRGNVRDCLVLLIGFVAMQVIRQFIEPRIVGQSVGIHPILALLSMSR